MSTNLPTEDLPVADIFGDPDFNCRGPITPFDVIELNRSIEQNGLLQPIVVQPYVHSKYKWRIVMGHRRHKAFSVAGRETISCVIKEGLSDLEARTMNLIENLERRDLTLMQEARAIEKFHIVGITQDDVAKMIGKSKGWVQTRFTALKLPKEIQNEIDAGFINQSQIRDIYSLPSKDQQYEVVREIKEAKLRGEKKPIAVKLKKKRTGHERRLHTESEIFDVQSKIQERIGNCFATRTLAWAAGAISENELMSDLQEEARKRVS